MNPNRIRLLRQKKGLTQRQLAEAVGTSQQQIQRIEAGVHSARLEVAARICAVLGETMMAVFPGTKRALARALKKDDLVLWKYPRAPKLVAKMERAGIDMDPEAWTLKPWLRGRGDPAFFSISGIEQKRLWDVLQEHTGSGFVVFDSDNERVALNCRHLVVWQFLWDTPVNRGDPTEKNPESLTVLTAGQSQPLEFDINGDEEAFDSEKPGSSMQLQSLLITLELFGDQEETVSFADADDEEVFLRTSDVILLKVPLWAVEPKLGEAQTADAIAELQGVKAERQKPNSKGGSRGR